MSVRSSGAPAGKVPDETTEDAKLARLAEQHVADLKWLMNQASGRRYLWWLLDVAGVYRTSFHSSGSITSFNEGARNVGLRVLDEIHEHAPDEYLRMLKEHR